MGRSWHRGHVILLAATDIYATLFIVEDTK
jgi:hypothetical protein